MSRLPYSPTEYEPAVAAAMAVGRRKRNQKTVNGKRWRKVQIPAGAAIGVNPKRARQMGVRAPKR